jgi:hypothetical protein
VAIGCRAEMDGTTKITLGTSPEVDPGQSPVFEGMLKTPSHQIVVRTVRGETILGASVPTRQTRIRIWIDRPTEPDSVVIGIA